MNRLSREKSAYLKHAANQTIDWYPWSDEAFERAGQEDKPVFLSTGAVWCHWCHVMARESFEDAETARLMNELFINIKLDRDERPDIDRRYQQAVAAMGSGSGWPLSVFLTPDRKPFFGGTYFPPEDRQGRPGFRKVLRAVSDFYRAKKDDAVVYAQRVLEALRPEALQPGELRPASIEKALGPMLSLFDSVNGGFGTAPKFPMPGALEFLLHRFFMTRDESVGAAVRKTLASMAAGGFHDHLGGGFHRYSVDEAWIVPHFEKMADDNAWLLRNYADGYAVFGDERFKDVALGIVRFLRDVLSDPAGGFFASQDADVTPEDEGGYFTWTDADFQRVLNGEEYRVLSRSLLHERGAMHHDPAKHVLYAPEGPEDVAREFGMSEDAVRRAITTGKEKLLRERNGRQAPFVDRTLYTSLNGMLIASCLRASAALGDPWAREFGIKSLECILRERERDGALFHSEGVPAVLDDYIHLVEALVVAYETTAEERFRDEAIRLMDRCLEKFLDRNEGGFFDTDAEVLGARLKRIEDIPHPSANAVAVMVLLKLFHLTGNGRYRHIAETILRIFSSSAGDMAIHAGYYYCGLDAWFHLLQLTVEAAPESGLALAARALSGPPVALAYGEDRGRVIPCVGTLCHEPVTSAEGLREFLTRVYRRE